VNRQSAAAGVEIAFLPVAALEDYRGASRNLLRLYRHLEGLRGQVVLARKVPELREARRRGLLAVVAQFQGLQMVLEDLSVIHEFSSAGVGVMALTHNWKNWNGDGCLERTDLRLTGLGELAVQAFNDSGILLDLSRAGRRTSLHAMELSRHPVIFSNSNAAGVHDHPRNLTDAQIDACAASDGVIGITAFPTFVGLGRPNLDRVLDHVEYVANRVGVEHVGLGLGFTDRVAKRFDSDPLPDSVPSYPAGIEGIEAFPRLRNALEIRGFGAGAVEAILGGNLYRALERVWVTA